MSYWAVKVGFVARFGGRQELAMDAAELKRLVISVTRLTPRQRAKLLAVLQSGSDVEEVCLLVESRLTESRRCPHCDDIRVVRNGFASGLQRYKCRTASEPSTH